MKFKKRTREKYKTKNVEKTEELISYPFKGKVKVGTTWYIAYWAKDGHYWYDGEEHKFDLMQKKKK